MFKNNKRDSYLSLSCVKSILISTGNPWSFLTMMVIDPSGSLKVLEMGLIVADPALATTNLVQSVV